MAHAQKPDFVFRRNGRVHLNRRGCQFSQLLAAEVCASAVVLLDITCSEVVWRVLATHSIRQFLLHFPFRAPPCATVGNHISTGLYYIFWVYICSHFYPACRVQAPDYIVIYGLSVCTIFFPHYLTNSKILWKTLLNIKWVFWFSVQFLSETFLILRRTERDIAINVRRSPCKLLLIFVRS